MIRRLSWLAVCAGLFGAMGCGDDDDTTGTDSGMVTIDGGDGVDGGVVLGDCTDIDMAPMPEQLMGACCYRTSNADRLDNPEFRLAGIRISDPAPLNNVLIQQLLRDALDSERFNWIFSMEITGTDVSVTTGYGMRNTDGTFSFVTGAAPGPGDPNRWDPVTATGTLSGDVVTTEAVDSTLTVPIIDEDGTSVVTELPLHGLKLTSATLSEERSCIGNRGPAAYRTDDGSLEGYITVAEAKDVMIETMALTATLCNLLAGMATATDNCADPQSDWPVPPDSSCDMTTGTCTTGGCDASTCNAWHVVSGFAAHGVEITP